MYGQALMNMLKFLTMLRIENRFQSLVSNVGVTEFVGYYFAACRGCFFYMSTPQGGSSDPKTQEYAIM